MANVTGAELTRVFGGGGGGLDVRVGMTFQARVLATNAVGRGQWSQWGSKVVAAPPGPPTAVGASVAGPLSINVTWVSPVDRGLGVGLAYPVTGYAVICVLSAGGGSRYVEVGGDRLSAIVGGMDKGVSYGCRVRARNDASDSGGWGLYSNTVDAVAFDVPSPPLGLSTATTGVPSFYLSVTWAVPQDTGLGQADASKISGYILEIFTTSPGLSSPANVTVSTLETAATVGPIPSGVPLTAAIRAKNVAGVGVPSTAAAMTVVLQIREPVLSLTSLVAGAGATATVQMTLPVAVPPLGGWLLRFPRGWDVSGCFALGGGGGQGGVGVLLMGAGACGFGCERADEDVVLMRSGDGRAFSAGERITLTIGGLVNRC